MVRGRRYILLLPCKASDITEYMVRTTHANLGKSSIFTGYSPATLLQYISNNELALFNTVLFDSVQERDERRINVDSRS